MLVGLPGLAHHPQHNQDTSLLTTTRHRFLDDPTTRTEIPTPDLYHGFLSDPHVLRLCWAGGTCAHGLGDDRPALGGQEDIV